jgi:predicted RNase H-like nuclease
MSWVAGVDGYHNGWFIVLKELGTGELCFRTVGTFSGILDLTEKPAVICVDIPIGLLDHAVHGGRECDRLTRGLLGHPRASSVFSPPVRSALHARTYDEAKNLNRRSSPEKIGISKQAYGILPKLVEVHIVMTPRLQKHIFEVHPELCFHQMNNATPMAHSKKSEAGFGERRALLARAGYANLIREVLEQRIPGLRRDDIVDACAACWSAERCFDERAITIPVNPPRDAARLSMCILR